MRLNEFITKEEWLRLERLIYSSTYKALTAYEQHREIASRIQQVGGKPDSTLKVQASKRSKAIAPKIKPPPHAAPPKPLPKPKKLPQTKAETHSAYRPVKTAKPLPPTTRMAAAKTHRAIKKPAPPSITDINTVDQAARRMLPPDKRGQNPTDLLSLDERG